MASVKRLNLQFNCCFYSIVHFLLITLTNVKKRMIVLATKMIQRYNNRSLA